MIYIKKIINQDLDRTPTFNVESIRDFFKINLDNGQHLLKKIILIPSNKEFDVKFQKRETRDEYRVFLNDLFREINPTEGDILILRKRNQDVFLCEHINNNNKSYDYLNHFFEEKSNHQLIISDSENNDNSNQPINLLDEFIEWFIKLDGSRHNYYSDFFSKNKEKLKSELINYEKIYENEFKTKVFTTSKNDINILKEAIKGNLEKKEGDFFEYSAKKSNHMPRAILGKNNYLLFLKELLNDVETSSTKSSKVHSINKIYFGPPGTGKSHAIKEYLKKYNVSNENYSRVTFHPDYDYHSFVGGYKPYTDINDNDKIKYKFVPQIFTELYVKAWSNQDEHYFLVIEEINRGNCSEIFGDIFQLLDRNPEYNIEPSSEFRDYLSVEEEKINVERIKNGEEAISLLINGKLQMPDNLSILASMNTSDQSLYPMDSAFKRRWEWKYIPIDTACKDSNFVIEIKNDKTYSWLGFIDKVNRKIYSVTKSEDKQIGNWFIDASKSDGIISKEIFINKVLFYLWNDVFKDETYLQDNIFVQKNDDGTKIKDLSFNDFHKEDNQDDLLIHLFEKVLGVTKAEDKAIEPKTYPDQENTMSIAAEPSNDDNDSE